MDESAIVLGIHPLGWNGGKDPGTIDGNSFLCVLSPAINGYVMDTLPGLVMAQHQRIRWYLLSMGSNENIHSIHFSGHVFTVRKTEEYKMAVYNLYPGTNQFVLCLQLPVLRSSFQGLGPGDMSLEQSREIIKNVANEHDHLRYR